jgi:hypothetical protein
MLGRASTRFLSIHASSLRPICARDDASCGEAA